MCRFLHFESRCLFSWTCLEHFSLVTQICRDLCVNKLAPSTFLQNHSLVCTQWPLRASCSHTHCSLNSQKHTWEEETSSVICSGSWQKTSMWQRMKKETLSGETTHIPWVVWAWVTQPGWVPHTRVLVGYDSGDGECIFSRHCGCEAGFKCKRLQATRVHPLTVKLKHGKK